MFSLMLQEPAKETKQEQSSKSEEPKFQAFSGKKYSLRGWWTFKQSNALKLSYSPVTCPIWIRDTMGVLYLSGMYYQKMKQ